MKNLFFGYILLIITSCSNDDNNSNDQNFIDYGYIPANVSINNGVAEFQAAIYNENHVFVATNDGLWKVNLTTKEWSRSGLEGKTITAIFKHPTLQNKFFAGTKSNGTNTDKTLYISDDGGVNWSQASSPIFDGYDNKYENYLCFAVRPNYTDHIYANLEGGTTIAVSTDRGNTWTRMNNESSSYLGYQSNIAFFPNNPQYIIQGSETPLDFAWLGKYEIDYSNPVNSYDMSKIVDESIWENRRPNELQIYDFAPNDIYVGQEGALSKVTGNTNKFIFKSENNNFPYSYIYAIWVDPTNTNHILFGGAINGENQPMSLYETFDEGTTINRFTNKLGLQNPEIMEIVSTNTYPAIIINDRGINKVKLVLFKTE